MAGEELVREIRALAQPFDGSGDDFKPILELVADRRLVLIGEASHGTAEFYRQRALLTKLLIREKGFAAIAVEADWPDAYRVNRFVRGFGIDRQPVDALGDFRRFPAWMWRNTEILDFVGWLREHNQRLSLDRSPVGFYGLDLYSLNSSIERVLDYLGRVDPQAAARARSRYSCFDHFKDTKNDNGWAEYGLTSDCEDAVIAQLLELQQRRAELLRYDGLIAEEEHFFAEQNARVVQNAEHYYRTMFREHASSWNIRDHHMAEMLDHLATHLDRQAGRNKIVVWAHNSHVGDARHTEMGDDGEFNIGQLMRERHPQETVLIGFSTYEGSVTAASSWDGPAERKRVRPGLPGSFEEIFHRVGLAGFLLVMQNRSAPLELLRERRLQRAIGVIYRPETERASHYFHVHLPDQFDAIIHLDSTHAVEPLESYSQAESAEPPETFPSKL